MSISTGCLDFKRRWPCLATRVPFLRSTFAVFPEPYIRAEERMRQEIEQAWEDRSLLKEERVVEAIEHTIELLDKGELRVADPPNAMPGQARNDKWTVNDWVKKGGVL